MLVLHSCRFSAHNPATCMSFQSQGETNLIIVLNVNLSFLLLSVLDISLLIHLVLRDVSGSFYGCILTSAPVLAAGATTSTGSQQRELHSIFEVSHSERFVGEQFASGVSAPESLHVLAGSSQAQRSL